ncbi:UNVERIFIED_CONTAM: hypothetical protein GTU68_008353 [Idotea baltica]|nr:hypothetical protein [Idotea baltica]
MLPHREFIIESEADLDLFAQKLILLLTAHQIIALTGDLGAGKTTLVAILCKHLKVEDDVSSPTFSIVNTYMTSEGNTVHHIDLYRLESAEEAMNMGIEEYLHSEAMVFIEWPEIIGHLLPEEIIHLKLLHLDEHRRKIVVL